MLLMRVAAASSVKARSHVSYLVTFPSMLKYLSSFVKEDHLSEYGTAGYMPTKEGDEGKYELTSALGEEEYVIALYLTASPSSLVLILLYLESFHIMNLRRLKLR